MARENRKSKAAYFLVDLSELSPEDRQELIEDAEAGGGTYGMRVVEEVHNGPAISKIYGVYFGDDAAKWDEAKKEFNITAKTVDDGEVSGEQGADPRTEAALRQAAEEAANAEAERVRQAETAELTAITGDDKASKKK